MAAPVIEKLQKAWSDAGREGTPRVVALSYFVLGPTPRKERRAT